MVNFDYVSDCTPKKLKAPTHLMDISDKPGTSNEIIDLVEDDENNDDDDHHTATSHDDDDDDNENNNDELPKEVENIVQNSQNIFNQIFQQFILEHKQNCRQTGLGMHTRYFC